jgi:type VI secretion system protein ImpJ
MSTNNKVVWYEGMFLQPQHFQQQDRHVDYILNRKAKLNGDHFWGFDKLELDHELLSVGKIAIREASGIFEDGTVFDIPNVDAPPAPFDIGENIANVTLYLAIPEKKTGVADTGVQSEDSPLRYFSVKSEVADVIADSKQVSDMQIGSLATRIISDQRELNGYSYLSITRIAETKSNHKIFMDKAFIPTCSAISVSKSLTNFVTEVHGLLNHRGQMLAERLTDSQAAGTAEVVDFVLLQMINRYEPLFHHLTQQKTVHPEALYKLLLQLMGEMSTFTNDKRRPIEAPKYDHKQLFVTYKPLIHTLRQALSMVLEQNATSVLLESRDHGSWVGQIHDKKIISTCRFILAAYSDIPGDELRASLPKQIKLAPVEQISTLVKRNLPGVGIAAMPSVPRQIPYHNNFTYFEVNIKHALWQTLEKSGGVAIHVSSPYPGLKLELWAIRG